MDPRHLADDTELCLAASALVGKLKLTHAQRELLKAVGREPRVADIVRRARLPERLAKRHLLRLIELELITFKTASGELDAVDPDRTSYIRAEYRPRQDSDVKQLNGGHDSGRVIAPLILDEEVEDEPASPRTATAVATKLAPQSRPILKPVGVIRPRQHAHVEPTHELRDPELDEVFERIQASPVNAASDGGGVDGEPTSRASGGRSDGSAEAPLGRVQLRTQPLGTTKSASAEQVAASQEPKEVEQEHAAPPQLPRPTAIPSTLPAGSPDVPAIPGPAAVPRADTPLVPVTSVGSTLVGDDENADSVATRPTLQVPAPAGQALGALEPHPAAKTTLPSPVPQHAPPIDVGSGTQGMVPAPPQNSADPSTDPPVTSNQTGAVTSNEVPSDRQGSTAVAQHEAAGTDATDTSGFVVAQSGDTERPSPAESSAQGARPPVDRPPPRFSGFEALHPEQEVRAAEAAGGAAQEPMQPLPRVKVPTPRELEATDPMAGQIIPLVRIVRSPMLTLGARDDSPRDATPIKPTGIVNLQAHNATSARPKHGPGEQPAVREEPTKAAANRPIAGMPVKTAGAQERHPSGGVGADKSSGGTIDGMPQRAKPSDSEKPQSGSTLEGMPAQSSHPPSQPRSGSTIEGMPAQSSQVKDPVRSLSSRPTTGSTLESMPAPVPDLRAPKIPTGLGQGVDLKSTLQGGMTASERDSQKRGGRTSVVVRSGAPRDDKTDHQPTGPTGRTLVGVLAPTESEIGSAATRVTGASTSTTLPSLHSAGVQRALNPQDRAEDSGEQPKTSDESLEHYQVLECLAKGGSGVVYRVQDPSAGQSQSLALKVLRQGQHRDSSAVGAFAREAELMDALSHRNLVQFVHFGHENDEPFLLMEYIEGLSMADLLHHPVPLPLDVGLIIIQDALEALDYVHNVRLPEVPEGLVHCDVSPQNLLVGADGRTRLIDFGTSRAPGKAVGDANVRCKPRYSSPEVMGGEAVGPEGDIFSMGAVLFQLLSKQPAFSADPRRRKKESLVPNPSLLNRRAPTPFDPICQRALDPDPQGRFSSAREMLEVLDAAVETSGIELRRARVSFWVRRVIQSRHGDVEFDMSELEDLLESKRSHHQEVPSTPSNEPPSSDGGENTKDVKPEKGRSVPPPPVRTEQRESSDPPSGALGAASRYSAAPTSEGVPLSFRARMWITGMAVGAAVAVLLFALLKPDVFKGWFSVKETPEWERNTPYQPTLEEAQRREEELEQRLRERLEAEPPEQAPTEAPAADGPEIRPVQGSSDSADSDEAPTTEPAGEASSNDAPAGGASKRQAESEGDTRSQASEKRAAKPRRAAVRQAPKPPQKPRAESQAPGTPTPTEPVTGAKPAPQVESGLPERPAEPQQATAQPTPEAPTAPTVPRTQQRPRGGLKPGVPVTP